MASRADHAPDALDYFPTPPWAARAGAELIGRLDPGSWSCWEPACGEGHLAHGLRDYFSTIVVSDIFDYGQGPDGVADFLAYDCADPEAEWIISNPPFKLGEAFVRTAWPRAQRGVAMLLRLAFLEGGARHKLLYTDCPLSVLAPFAERVPMVKGRWDPEASSATAYAWFIWQKYGDHAEARILPIGPGAKARLSRPEDARVFGAKDPGPLFGSAA